MQKVLDLWELFHCREILPWQIKSTCIMNIKHLSDYVFSYFT